MSSIPGPKINPVGRLEREIRSLTGRMSKKSVSTDSEIEVLRETIATLSARLASITNHVHGMDIYIQATDPNIPDDYIWIDTNGIDLINI